MKKKELISILALLAIFTGSLQAQTAIILSPEIGIQSSKLKATGDLDVNSLFQSQDVNYSSIFSYHGGLNFGIQFSGNWAILTGVKFNQKGGKVSVETRDPNNPFFIQKADGTVGADVGMITQTSKQNWLSIPILARAQFGNTVKVGLAIGPQFNLGIGEYKETIEYDLENTNLPTEENSEPFGTSTGNLYKKSHMSLVVLPYVSYQINKQGAIKLSVLIESGSDMVNENYVVPAGIDANGNQTFRNVSGSIKNSQFGVSLAYVHTFDLKAGVKY